VLLIVTIDIVNIDLVDVNIIQRPGAITCVMWKMINSQKEISGID